MEPAAERSSAALETRMVADEQTGVRVATGLMHYRLTRPQVLIGWPVMAVLLLAFGWSQGELPVMAGLVAVLFSLSVTFLYVTARRTMVRFFAPGSVHSTSFRPGSMTIAGPYGFSEIRYELFKQVWLDRSVVILRQRPTRIFNIVPIELVPAEALSVIRAGIVTD